MWLLLLLAAAAARTAAGADCSVGMGCDLALGSYYISRNQNLYYISSLFGIDDYRTTTQGTPTWISYPPTAA